MPDHSARSSDSRLLDEACFVGRSAELEQLTNATERLAAGQSSVVTLSGEAGTGKTRLVQELRSKLDPNRARWVSAQARADSTSAPYHVLESLFRGLWGIDELDDPDVAIDKLRAGAADLFPDNGDAADYLARLLGVESVETSQSDPELWRARVYELLGNARTGPTVICVEDLHWGDPSSVALLRHLAMGGGSPTLWLCAARPPFELFDAETCASLGSRCVSIELTSLSRDDSEELVKSLLASEDVPAEVVSQIHERTGGNPFQTEELVHTLLESDALVHFERGWELTREIDQAGSLVTLADVLSSRMTHLSTDAMHVLKEASIIGREFPYEVISKMTSAPVHLDESLKALVEHDLMRTANAGVGQRYTFKHDLTQEAAYGEVGGETRPSLHERLAEVLEGMYAEREGEVSEDLAFHYERGLSLNKAVQYLMMSGAKCHSRYALEEADRYFRRAFELVASAPEQDEQSRALLVDILGAWGMIFPFRGDFEGLRATIAPHRELVESAGNPGQLAGYYIAMSAGAWGCGIPEEGVHYAELTCRLADEVGHVVLSALGRNAIAWSGLEMGRLDEAVQVGWEGFELCKDVPGEQLPQYACLHATGIAHWYTGNTREAMRTAEHLDEYSSARDSQRGRFAAAIIRGHAEHAAGRLGNVTPAFDAVAGLSADPVHQWGPLLHGGIAVAEMGDWDEAERKLLRVHAETDGVAGYFNWHAQVYLGLRDAGRGRFVEADRKVREAMEVFAQTHMLCREIQSEYVLGKVFRMLAEAARGNGCDVANFGIDGIESAEDADREAERWLLRSIERAESIGAHGVACPASLELAVLHAGAGRDDQAREWAQRALEDAEDRDADGYAARARELLGAAGT